MVLIFITKKKLLCVKWKQRERKKFSYKTKYFVNYFDFFFCKIANLPRFCQITDNNFTKSSARVYNNSFKCCTQNFSSFTKIFCSTNFFRFFCLLLSFLFTAINRNKVKWSINIEYFFSVFIHRFIILTFINCSNYFIFFFQTTTTTKNSWSVELKNSCIFISKLKCMTST